MRFFLSVVALVGLTGAVQADSLTNALKAVPGADSAAATDAATSAVSSAATDALSVENFDPEMVTQLIDQSSLDSGKKETLKQGVQMAADNPEMVQGTLDQVKAALGM